jgi:hypothetical protein
MKNNPANGKTDPELHVRKKVAGGATGAVLGAVVAGPLGAIVGGAVGTMIGRAAERGTPLEIPALIKKRSTAVKVQERARGKASKRSAASAGSMTAKKTAAPASKSAAASQKARSKK